MEKFALTGCRVILPDRELSEGHVVVCDGRITDIGQGAAPTEFPRIDLQDKIVVPGYIDLHVHGGDGADFMDGDVDAVFTACQAHLRHGTTRLFPTTTTGSPDQILAMITACRRARDEIASGSVVGAQIEGVHLYGPFFAPDKVGCHSPYGRRDPTEQEYARYFDTGMIRIATCAAELPGAAEFYQTAAARGCFLTCGHSNASWTEMAAAFQHGVRHVDHFWCAMSSVASLRQRFGVPMQASMAEFVLAHPEMSTEVIADGEHLAPDLLQFAYRMIGPDRLCLVTDCNRALDRPPGEYRFGNRDDGSPFYSDGQVGWLPDQRGLASSIRGMDWMVRHMARWSGATLPEVVRMATLTPARRLGIDDHVGSIEVGKQADLLILGEDLQVEQVIVAGHLVFEAN